MKSYNPKIILKFFDLFKNMTFEDKMLLVEILQRHLKEEKEKKYSEWYKSKNPFRI